MIITGAIALGWIVAAATPGILGHVFALVVWAAAAFSCVRPARAGTASAARTWARIGVAAFACLAVYAGSLAIIELGSGNQNWYADGKAFALRDNQVDGANLAGPPGIVQTWCTSILDSGTAPVPTGPLPPTTDNSAVANWVSGCVDGYDETHANG